MVPGLGLDLQRVLTHLDRLQITWHRPRPLLPAAVPARGWLCGRTASAALARGEGGGRGKERAASRGGGGGEEEEEAEEEEQEMEAIDEERAAEEDKGGAVYPSQTCPHVFEVGSALWGCETLAELEGLMRGPFSAGCSSCGHGAENWICVTCLSTGCSRFVEAHMEEHFYSSLALAAGGAPPHSLALSRSDLSVWCYSCNSYVKHNRLVPMLAAAERLKFPDAYSARTASLDPKQHSVFRAALAFQPEEVHTNHAHPAGSNKCFERPLRLIACLNNLENKALLAKLLTISLSSSPQDGTSSVELVHDPGYVAAVRAARAPQQADLYQTPDSAQVAEDAVARLVALVDAVVQDEHLCCGFALLRPPGHHAEAGRGGGFCIFNNVAIAAQHAIERRGKKRVAIVDWDIHHGNGAQQIFYNRSDVLTISIHKQTASVEVDGVTRQVVPSAESMDDCTGAGDGLGFNVNVPLGDNCSIGDDEYRFVFEQIVLKALAKFSPDLVLIAAGFDACVSDLPLPVGGYSVTPSGYGVLTQLLLDFGCANCCPVVASLEGGYDIQGLADCVEACVRVMTADEGAGPVATANPSPPPPLPPPVILDPETVAIVSRVSARFGHWA